MEFQVFSKLLFIFSIVTVHQLLLHYEITYIIYSLKLKVNEIQICINYVFKAKHFKNIKAMQNNDCILTFHRFDNKVKVIIIKSF